MNADSLEVPFPLLLQEFFSQRLIAQRNVSPRTVASYRDTFRLLLRFTQQHLKKPPSDLSLGDLDAPLVLRFLGYLEQDRSVAVRTRNNRLAAIRSFMRYAALCSPTALPLVLEQAQN